MNTALTHCPQCGGLMNPAWASCSVCGVSVKHPPDPITIEPAENVKPVYWLSDNKIVGPGRVSHMAKVGTSEFWLCVEYAGSWLWINSNILRSRDSFERQGERVCPCCGGSEWWTSIHGATVCQKCHPPAVPSVVKGEF